MLSIMEHGCLVVAKLVVVVVVTLVVCGVVCCSVEMLTNIGGKVLLLVVLSVVGDVNSWG